MDRLRVTQQLRYLLSHVALVWFALTLLLIQGDLAMASLLLAAALVSATLARPWELVFWTWALGLVTIVGWSWPWIGANLFVREGSGFALSFFDTRTSLGAAWNAAGWWGFPSATSDPDAVARFFSHRPDLKDMLHWPAEARLPIQPEYTLNALVQFHGWTAAGAVITATMLQSLALFRLASRARGDNRRVERWTGWIYAGILVLMAGLSTTAAAGWLPKPFPACIFPWLGGAADLSSLHALAWLVATVFAFSQCTSDGVPHRRPSQEKQTTQL